MRLSWRLTRFPVREAMPEANRPNPWRSAASCRWPSTDTATARAKASLMRPTSSRSPLTMRQGPGVHGLSALEPGDDVGEGLLGHGHRADVQVVQTAEHRPGGEHDHDHDGQQPAAAAA